MVNHFILCGLVMFVVIIIGIKNESICCYHCSNKTCIPELCEEGTYRNSDMTHCRKCDRGYVPVENKTYCGK